MLTREAFEHEIRRFEKEIENELTDESKETLWRFFSDRTVKFMKETLGNCVQNLENFKMAVKNGNNVSVSKPKDIQAIFNVMDSMLDAMKAQNESWYRYLQKTNRNWTIIYCFLFLLHMWSIL